MNTITREVVAELEELFTVAIRENPNAGEDLTKSYIEAFDRFMTFMLDHFNENSEFAEDATYRIDLIVASAPVGRGMIITPYTFPVFMLRNAIAYYGIAIPTDLESWERFATRYETLINEA